LARCTFVPQSDTKDLALSGSKILRSRIFVVSKRIKITAQKLNPAKEINSLLGKENYKASAFFYFFS